MDAIQKTKIENIIAKVQNSTEGMEQKVEAMALRTEQNTEIEDRRETIKPSPGGQHWNPRVPARQNRVKLGKDMSQEIFQKNFTGLKNKFPD